ncbi:hypothetical protein [Iningainema tapete]|uniref:Uncharacterized protein n=1 Tax=Iningainema tapete BLCC-T55 TaxID=2748662 RepID=A0A8J7C5Y4_9CYAN|nr:hypothetical protein [Iningainema tapete]MBD2773639.1 hypothetical protein [Iningainema tapete BLCC-T55]
MIISDLNYLEAVTETVVGGRHLNFDKNLLSNIKTNLDFDSNTNINEVVNKNANIRVNSNVVGNSATFAFDNEAIGPNSTAEGTLSQITIAGEGSSQSGTFISATNK